MLNKPHLFVLSMEWRIQVLQILLVANLDLKPLIVSYMTKDRIVEMVKEINPREVFPVHIENQDLFKTFCCSTQIVENVNFLNYNFTLTICLERM